MSGYWFIAHSQEHPEGSAMLVQFTRVIGSWRCSVPVLPDGDGAESAELEERTAKCPHRTELFLGSAATCAHHLRVVLPMVMLTEREIAAKVGPLGVCATL